jgi:hypothetical protein
VGVKSGVKKNGRESRDRRCGSVTAHFSADFGVIGVDG